MKYYMEKDGDWAFPLSEFTARIHNGEKEIYLEEMRKETLFELFCVEFKCFVKKGDCGLHCDKYNPCNGYPGRCRYLSNGFIGMENFYRLTNKGLEVME